MMDTPKRRKRQQPRSRSGCLECRQHHQKCDERRPTCGLCQVRGRSCQYGLRISWGGRPFRKSTFGHCMSSDSKNRLPIIQIQSTQTDTTDARPKHKSAFVYGVAPTSKPYKADSASVVASLIEARPQHVPLQATIEPIKTLQAVTAPPSLFPDLPPAYRSLLDYFTHVLNSFCCDESVKKDFCKTFLPIALDTSHVMASVLNLAAVHRVTAGLPQCTKQLALLRVVSVEQLRSQLDLTSGPPTEATMATILMLCYSEVVSGGERSYSWRLHLEGAASLLSRALSVWKLDSGDSTKRFIARCFVSLVSLANMSVSPPTALVSNLAVQIVGEKGPDPHVDSFTAYSTALFPVFHEFGDLVRARREDAGNVNIPERALRLMQQLELLNTNAAHRDSDFVAPAQSQEYGKVNEAYHHAAILQIQQRLLAVPATTKRLQETLRVLLGILSSVELTNEPCPGVVLFFPTFAAGCAATLSTDRNRVRDILKAMMERYRLANVEHGINVLEKLWSMEKTGIRGLCWENMTGESESMDQAPSADMSRSER
ncbi:hypothetical protein S40293_08020 [Stachybotrys chartarum IBT 40293]|nr:hypothetical protein S40293_08020 [Stachybotrys chartarum IBT 40293]